MKWGQECRPPPTQGEERRACICNPHRARLSGEHVLPRAEKCGAGRVPQAAPCAVSPGGTSPVPLMLPFCTSHKFPFHSGWIKWRPFLHQILTSTSSTLAWKIPWTEEPVGVSKSWTRLSHFTFNFHSHAWEKEMATHSSILAWRIPGSEEPGGLLSMGSQSVRHN